VEKKGKERERGAINNTKQQNWEIYKCARKEGKKILFLNMRVSFLLAVVVEKKAPDEAKQEREKKKERKLEKKTKKDSMAKKEEECDREVIERCWSFQAMSI
jgi:hypothetical protein